MSKKLLTSGIIAIILFFTTAFCYAAEEGNTSSSDKMDLGNELTESMNKVNKSADNMTDNIKNDDTADGAMMNDNDDTMKKDDNGLRSDYNATRTSLDNDLNNGTGMTGTTWIWIILAIVGVVILATVWFYAMQNSGND